MEIGERLKEARETKDISLDNLQEITKIQKRYLVAIEEGEFHVLPGKFYARAFIREYASAVGLDSSELLEDHNEQIPSPENESTAQYTGIRRSRRSDSSTKSSALFSFIPTVIVVLLVIGIFFVAWSLYQKSAPNGSSDLVEEQDNDEIIRNIEGNDTDKETNQEDINESEQTDDAETDMETDTEELEFSLVKEGTGNSPESTFDLNNVGVDVQLTLESTEDTYLEVTGESGEVFFTGMFTPDQSPEEFDLSEEDRVYFNIGHAPGLSITINGAELEYPIEPKTSVHQKIWVNLNKAAE